MASDCTPSPTVLCMKEVGVQHPIKHFTLSSLDQPQHKVYCMLMMLTLTQGNSNNKGIAMHGDTNPGSLNQRDIELNHQQIVYEQNYTTLACNIVYPLPTN